MRRFRRGRGRRRRSGTTFCCAFRPKFSPAARSSGACSRAKKARPSRKVLARRPGPGRSSTSSLAKCCGFPERSSRSVRPNIDIEVTREPLGVVGIIAPWNFPLAIPSWKIAPALAYGNTVVFKPADLVPGCAHALSEIIVRAGVPKGVFNLVVGRGSVVGQAILEHKKVDAVTFTGSVATGAKVAAACAKAMRRFQLEMGGKNPLVVLADADLKNAVECAVNGAYFSTGQRCTASSRLIVEEPIYRRFADALTERMRGTRRRRRAESRNAYRAGGRRIAIRAGSVLYRRLARAKARSWRSAANGSIETRPASTWPLPSSLTPTTRCASRARKSSAPSRR